MASPIADKITLPLDSGNTGKKVRTQTRVVGADTVHEHFFILEWKAKVLGTYRLGLAQQTVLASAQNGTSTGFLWIHMPTAISGKSARLRRLRIDSQHSTALATPTAPRITAVQFTFTGTASGAQVAAIENDRLGPAAVLDLRTAVTGLTPSLIGALSTAGLSGAVTAVGAYPVVAIDMIDLVTPEDSWPVIAPGEGVVIYQDVAGTASDTRKFNLSMLWDEVDTA